MGFEATARATSSSISRTATVSKHKPETAVAVVSTCYNQEEYITDCLQSVACQETGATVHHVVVDDGSSDGSLDILRAWESTHDNVKVLSITNRGMAGAFNAGLMALPAEVEYVVILAGDDWLAMNFVDACLDAMKPRVDIVVPSMRRVYEDLWSLPEKVRLKHPSVEEVWQWYFTYAYGVGMIRREALVEAGGFHPGVGGDCDWDMWIDLISRGKRFGYTDQTHFYYRRVLGSSSSQKTKEMWDMHRTEMQRHHKRSYLPGRNMRDVEPV